ncbi:hypothetical protein AB0C81_21600 [Streptomyces roseoverticillatus]|uniref:hypothetical protein n=1 Tax=Streptomyces roseoverticillatus TaxID=66429 RepID=UPI0033C8D2A9
MDTMTLAPAPAETAETAAATATAETTATASPEEIKPLPTWFFAFEGLMSAAYDLFQADHRFLWALGALGVANLIVSLTVLRSRLRLAKRMWRGKSTRKVAIGLLALRLGSHLALTLAGFTVVSAAGHLAFAVLMSATTVTLLWYAQRVSLRALAAESV